MFLDPAALDKPATYALLTSVIVPRPIAWVGTRGPEGVDNLAPFSYFMGVASEPPLVAISVSRGRAGALKDTARNLLQTQECTISVVSAALLEPMHQSSAPYPPEVSEFAAVGLSPAPGVRVQAPRVAEARAALEAVLYQAHDLGNTHLFVLRVVGYHLPEAGLQGGKVPIEQLDPVARLGSAYATLGPEVVLPPARVR